MFGGNRKQSLGSDCGCRLPVAGIRLFGEFSFLYFVGVLRIYDDHLEN